MPVPASYLLCATPRTGSYLLCDLLKQCRAGRPTEYFSPGYQGYWAPRWRTADYASYLARALSLAEGEDGIRAVKAHPRQFQVFLRRANGGSPPPVERERAVAERWLPECRYIWLRRRDRIRQALSWARSMQTNIWWDAAEAPAPFDEPKPDALRFDGAFFDSAVARMAEEDGMWADYFRAGDIEPLTIWYEDLAADPMHSLKQVLVFLDLADRIPTAPPATTFRKQSDAVSERWVRRYEALRRGPPTYETLAALEPKTFDLVITSGTFEQPPWWDESRHSLLAVTPYAGPFKPDYALGDGPCIPPAEVVFGTGGVEVPSGTEPTDIARQLGARSVREVRPEPVTVPALCDVLAHRRWWFLDSPIRHVRAERVFSAGLYEAMAALFAERLARGDMTRSLPGYDASAAPVTASNAGPFAIFLSREWHDMIAGLFGVQATGEVIASLHHHAPGSASGQPHNDLNPGWFPAVPIEPGTVRVHDPAVNNYTNGTSRSGVPTVERVRAVAVLYYLATPDDVVGGETGLYRTQQQGVDRPDARVPPRNNSLLAFECTPYSFHSFMSNTLRPRNCVAMWLHRTKDDAVARWGERSIVGWPS